MSDYVPAHGQDGGKTAMELWAKLAEWWATTPATEKWWLVIGFTAELMFVMRFIVQWVASEWAKRSVVPDAFWLFSVLGGSMLLAYAIYRVDPVFIVGQAGGLAVYLRNIHLIRKHRRAMAASAAA